MKPIYQEDATKSIQDIILNMEKSKNAPSNSWIEERKKELIQKMKEDTDNKEYPIMLNALMFVLVLSCLYNIFFNEMYFLTIVLLLAMVYYAFVLYKLKNAIIQLQEDKKDIDEYMLDGYLIKDTRFTAVKFAYLLFFPIICFLAFKFVEDLSSTLPLWQYFVPALVISSVAWFMFFSDDQEYLDNLESEIKGLKSLS
ncbi:MAG: hypothetical protein WAT79_06160 [Saprospiraceae bacterium]